MKSIGFLFLIFTFLMQADTVVTPSKKRLRSEKITDQQLAQEFGILVNQTNEIMQTAAQLQKEGIQGIEQVVNGDFCFTAEQRKTLYLHLKTVNQEINQYNQNIKEQFTEIKKQLNCKK